MPTTIDHTVAIEPSYHTAEVAHAPLTRQEEQYLLSIGRLEAPAPVTRRRFVAMGAPSMAVAAFVVNGPPTRRGTAIAADRGAHERFTRQLTPVPDELSYSDALVQEVIAALAEAGVVVYAAADDPAPIITPASPGPLHVLRWQVERMVMEAVNFGGQVGEQLDAFVAEPGSDGSEIIPPSLLIAGYLAETDSPGADLARRFLPELDFDHVPPDQTVFPTLVLLTFAAEIAREFAEETAGVAPSFARLSTGQACFAPGPAPTFGYVGATTAVPMSLLAQGGACSAVQSFIDNTISAFFQAIQVNLGSPVPGRIVGGIINWLLGRAEAAARAVVEQITAPVLEAIRAVVGVVGTAAMVVSAIRPWTVRVTPDPTVTRLAVGAEAPIPGQFDCLVDLGGFDEWPADVADCAAVSGVPLPPLRPELARTTWDVRGSRPNLVFITEQPQLLDRSARATLRYVTGSEDAETARGREVVGWVRTEVVVARPQVDEMQRLLTDLLFSQLPGIARQFLQPILGPQVQNLLGQLAALSSSRGNATISVIYHEPPEPSPEPEPETGDAGTISFRAEPKFAHPLYSTQWIDIEASSCNGIDWDGTFRVVMIADLYPYSLDLDETVPIQWSFARGEQASIEIGPFTTELVFMESPLPLVVEFTLTIARGSAEGTTLTFGGEWCSFFDELQRAPLEAGFTNFSVPLAVTPGGC